MALKEAKNVFGGTGADQANSIFRTTDGGFVVAGSTGSINGDVSGNHGDRDVWVIKLNALGTLQWKKTLGGTGTDIANAIIQTSDGGYAVAGETRSNNGNVSVNHGRKPMEGQGVIGLIPLFRLQMAAMQSQDILTRMMVMFPEITGVMTCGLLNSMRQEIFNGRKHLEEQVMTRPIQLYRRQIAAI